MKTVADVLGVARSNLAVQAAPLASPEMVEIRNLPPVLAVV